MRLSLRDEDHALRIKQRRPWIPGPIARREDRTHTCEFGPQTFVAPITVVVVIGYWWRREGTNNQVSARMVDMSPRLPDAGERALSLHADHRPRAQCQLVAERLTSEGVTMARRRVFGYLVSGAAAAVLAGCGQAPSESATTSSSRPSSTSSLPTSTSAPSLSLASQPFVAGGARADDGLDGWVLGTDVVSITRDGGASWERLALPQLGRSSGVADVSVLPGEVVIVVGNDANETATVYIDKSSSPRCRWRRLTAVAVLGGVAHAEVVDANGVLQGVMITAATGSAFSSGVFLGTPDAGRSWRLHRAPVGGVVTVANGLWLVGGVTNEDVYLSRDGGARWQPVHIPVTLAGMVGFGPVASDGDQAVLTATAGSTTQVVTGDPVASRWSWTAGPVLRLGGQYGGGAAALSSLAEGVLWVISPTDRVARVVLSRGRVSEASGNGLPFNGSLSLYAMSDRAAWAVYSSFSCSYPKSGCPQIQGLLRTADGGRQWSVMRDPLAIS